MPEEITANGITIEGFARRIETCCGFIREIGKKIKSGELSGTPSHVAIAMIMLGLTQIDALGADFARLAQKELEKERGSDKESADKFANALKISITPPDKAS